MKLYPTITNSIIRPIDLPFSSSILLGKSSPIFTTKSRKWQKNCDKELNDFQYRCIVGPPGSGKSRMMMQFAYKDIVNKKCKKVIIIVPQQFIAQGYRKPFYKDIEGKEGQFILTHVLDSKSKDQRSIKIKTFFDHSPTKGHPEEGILVCTYDALCDFVFKNKNDSKYKLKFKNTALWVDEYHHNRVSLTKQGKEGTKSNLLNETTSYFINLNCHVGIATATPFRGDGHALLATIEIEKFKVFLHAFDTYLSEDCVYLKGLQSETSFFKFGTSYYGAVIQRVKQNKGKPTIIFIADVNTKCSKHTGHEKLEQVNELIVGLKKINKNFNIINLVDPSLRTEGYEKIEAQNKLAEAYNLDPSQDRPNIDIIIALKVFKEGADYIPLQHAIIVGFRYSITDLAQMTGRLTRDYRDKEEFGVKVCYVLPGIQKQLDMEKTKKLFDDNMNVVWLNMLLMDHYAPYLKYKTITMKGNITKRVKEDEKLWREVFGSTYIKVRQELARIFNSYSTGFSFEEEWDIIKDRAIDIMKPYAPDISDTNCKKIYDYMKVLYSAYTIRSNDINEIKSFSLIEKEVSPSGLVRQYEYTMFEKGVAQKFRDHYKTDLERVSELVARDERDIELGIISEFRDDTRELRENIRIANFVYKKGRYEKFA